MNTNDTTPQDKAGALSEVDGSEKEKTVVKPRMRKSEAESTYAPLSSSSEKTRIQPRARKTDSTELVKSVQPAVSALDDGTVIRPRRRSVPLRPVAKAKTRTLIYRSAKVRTTDDPDRGDAIGSNTPPLLLATQPVFGIIPELKQCTDNTDLKTLREAVCGVMRRFQAQLRATVGAVALRKSVSYVLCALIDELVITSSWGEHSDWSRYPLLSEFHGETYGGERVYQILDHALQAPRANTELLEIIYLVLLLGFQGELRLDTNGETKIHKLCQEIYALLPEVRRYPTGFIQESKPENVSLARVARVWQSFAPLWLFVAMLTVLAFGVYTFLHVSSSQNTDEVINRLAEVVTVQKVTALPRGEIRPEVVRLKQQLSEEIQQGVLRITEYTTHTEIALVDPELFPSGSTRIAESAQPVLYKIAKVLESLPGNIVVSGHTDDQDIKTAQYPSNWHLSLARAAAIVSYLEAQATFLGRIVPEGRGAEQPLSRDNTVEARARNRRVVIEWYYGGES